MGNKSTNDQSTTSTTNWEQIELSRHPQRPYTLDYIPELFEDFLELKGDRCFKEDPALIAGMGVLKAFGSQNPSQSVFFVGHQKGRNTKEKIHRNFGMAKPEGYRKAIRVFELAERFQKPVICFIDTPGAFPGVGAEERGQAEAIASCIDCMLKLSVPSVGVVIGEGGSGGALAIGSTNSLLMMENATYSVISPESCAAILWGTADEAKKAAEALKPTAQFVKKLGICDEIIQESEGGAHTDLSKSSQNILKKLHKHLSKLNQFNTKERQEQKWQKYRFFDEQNFS